MIQIDVIGTLYDPGTYDTQGQEITPAVPLAGYHVNTTHPVAAWAAKRVDPSTPRRVFGGAQTLFYTFASEAEYLAAVQDVDLTEPPPPARVPFSVTRRQAKAALLLRGKLALVQPAIDAIPDATQRGLMQIEWDDSGEFVRSRASVIAIGAAIGYDSDGLDDVFTFAATLP